MSEEKAIASWEQFEQLDIRTGTVLSAELLQGAKKPAYKLQIDFGAIGIKNSSAQITQHYTPEQLINTTIIAIINFPEKRIAGFKSECLVLGIYKEDESIVLLRPSQPVKNGLKIG
ncbi:MAG: tRNA-binding protein [Hydrotalea sp.]|nr:tRNA-binding protein [Hydrotalea sp.]